MFLIRCNLRALVMWFATAVALWIAVPAFAQTTGSIRVTGDAHAPSKRPAAITAIFLINAFLLVFE